MNEQETPKNIELPETPPVPEMPEPAEMAGVQPAEGAAPAGPSFFQKAMQFLFAKEGKVGRVLRPVLRYAAIIVGMFALGMLATYILYYQPQARTLEETQSQLQSVQGELDTAQTDLQQTRRDLDKATADLAAATTHGQVLDVLYKVNTIRYALAAGDKGAASTALDAANSALETLLPTIEAGNAEVAEAIQDRLDIVEKGMSRDPKTAQADLALLVETLQNLVNTQ